MKADTITIQQLFQNQVQYWVPFYQRSYTWTQIGQWEPLWEDVVRKAEERKAGNVPTPHFLGAVVLEPQVKEGFLGVEQLHIIDGQQRLTTLQFLLKGLQLALIEAGDSPGTQAVVACVRNGNVETMRNREIERFKLWPTYRDRELFGKVMGVSGLAELEPLFKDRFTQQGRLRRDIRQPAALGAVWHFATAASEWLRSSAGTGSDGAAEALVAAVLRDLKLVSIVLDDKDDAQVIFETINSRGVELHATDLIRNYVFMTADRQGEDSASLYETYWKPFETDEWSEKQTRGRISKPRFDWLIHSSLQARLGQEIELNRLYFEYRRFAENEGKLITVPEQLQILSGYAEHYRELLSGKGDSPIARFGNRIRDFDVTTLHPLALLIASSDVSDEDKSSMFNCLVSYLVRRAVCGLTAKNYNNTFLSALRQLKVVGVSPENLRSIFSAMTSDISRWPDDAAFKRACVSDNLYPGRITAPRMRMILTELEARLRLSGRPEEREPSLPSLSSLDIDHILPQKWSMYWDLPNDTAARPDPPRATEEEIRSTFLKRLVQAELTPREAAIAEREELVPTLGNLTLLNLSVNREAQNYQFDRKCELLIDNTTLRLNVPLVKRNSWDETAIKERAELLASTAVKTWPGPAAQAMTPV